MREKLCQNLLVLRLAQIGANQEEQERRRNADGNLMQAHNLEAHTLRQAVNHRTAAHRKQCAELISPPPEQAQ